MRNLNFKMVEVSKLEMDGFLKNLDAGSQWRGFDEVSKIVTRVNTTHEKENATLHNILLSKRHIPHFVQAT